MTALLAGCFFIGGCENSEQQIKDLTSRRIGIEEGKGISINYSVGGKTKAILTAPLMLRHQDTVPFIEFPKRIHADFYDDNLTVESRLDALYGRYMETQSKVYLRDSVQLFSKNGDTLYCDELYWDRHRTGREFYTDKPVQIRTNTHLINGIGFESNHDFTYKEVRKVTNSIFRLPASGFPQ